MKIFFLINIIVGFIFGFVAQRADFCLHGILSEHVLMKTRTKLIGLGALWLAFFVIFYPLAFVWRQAPIPPTGLVPLRVAHLAGGLILGFGSVFAGG